VGKPEGRRALGRPRQRWEDGIRMDIRETGWWCLECTQLRIGRGVNTVMNLRVLGPRNLLLNITVR
jgi:hypothetical protein